MRRNLWEETVVKTNVPLHCMRRSAALSPDDPLNFEHRDVVDHLRDLSLANDHGLPACTSEIAGALTAFREGAVSTCRRDSGTVPMPQPGCIPGREPSVFYCRVCGAFCTGGKSPLWTVRATETHIVQWKGSSVEWKVGLHSYGCAGIGMTPCVSSA